MQILITNSVPLNGGDEALLRATYLFLSEVFPNSEITVLCAKLDLCKKYIKDIKLDSDLDFIDLTPQSLSEKINYKIRCALSRTFNISWRSGTSLMFANNDEKRITSYYRNADLIISSPGGFIHDFYHIDGRLSGFQLALDFKKKIILFAQSIGPFWKTESISKISQIFPKISAIILREKISMNHLIKCGVESDNLFLTTDAAFLLHKYYTNLYIKKTGEVKKIVMSFREWPINVSNNENMLKKIVAFCKYLIVNGDKHIYFLSTCQCISDTIDDSVLAEKILNSFSESEKKYLTIIKERYSAIELIKKYSYFDAYIGMRLHGAILSMLGGTPAMAIGYEDKTKGIFNDMGFLKYQVDFEKEVDEWIACVNSFLSDIELIRDQLPYVIDKQVQKANLSIDILKKVIN
jgi:colanic acid/amylovoran biosynthesis protein